MEFLEGWDGRLGQNIGLSPVFRLTDWLLLGPWQPRGKAPSGYGGGGMGQQARFHLCSVFIHPKATPSPSLPGGKVQPGFFLQVPARGVVWNSLEKALSTPPG